MNDTAKLYDEFFEWLDTKISDIQIPTLFPELAGFEMSASDFLSQIKKSVYIGDGYHDNYADVLFDLWYKNKNA